MANFLVSLLIDKVWLLFSQSWNWVLLTQTTLAILGRPHTNQAARAICGCLCWPIQHGFFFHVVGIRYFGCGCVAILGRPHTNQAASNLWVDALAYIHNDGQSSMLSLSSNILLPAQHFFFPFWPVWPVWYKCYVGLQLYLEFIPCPAKGNVEILGLVDF